MWTITNISEADYGCEERLPGEPLLVLVTIENDDGRVCMFECAEDYLIKQELDEGDEWPEDIEAIDSEGERFDRMSDWMENYYQALEEMEEDN